MAHIHISLIGGQSYPVYLGIADLNPDGIILIHSSQSREEAERIQQEIDAPTHLLEFDPVLIFRASIISWKRTLHDFLQMIFIRLI